MQLSQMNANGEVGISVADAGSGRTVCIFLKPNARSVSMASIGSLYV